MPMPFSAYSLWSPPWSDQVRTATVSALNPGLDADYSIENVQTDATDDTYRSASAAEDTLTITFPGGLPEYILAAFFFNTNAESIRIRNEGAVLDFPVTVLDPTRDGHPRDAWAYLGDQPENDINDDEWYIDLEKTGTAKLEIGRIFLATIFGEVLWLPDVEFGLTRPGAVRHRTKGGRVHRRLVPWAPVRTGVGKFLDLDELSVLRMTEAASNGLGQGFPLVENRTVGEAMFMQLAEDAQQYRGGASHIELTLRLEEIARGLTPECDWEEPT